MNQPNFRKLQLLQRWAFIKLTCHFGDLQNKVLTLFKVIGFVSMLASYGPIKAQSITVTPTATNVTCNGSANGSVNLAVSGGTASGSCAGTTTSPYTCTSCSQTISGSGTYTVNNGYTYCITSNFTGSVTINSGGTLKICGTASPSSFNLNGGTLIVNGTLNYNLSGINTGITVYNYGTINSNSSFNINGTFNNYGSFSCTSLALNSSGTLNNNGTFNVSGDVGINGILSNNGSLAATGNLNFNSSGTVTNNCSISGNGDMQLNTTITFGNNSTLSVGGYSHINSNGTLALTPGCLFSTYRVDINGSISNSSSYSCSKVSVSNSCTVNGSGSVSGKVSMCVGGSVTNYGSVNWPAGFNCSCSASGSNGGSPSYTYSWSNGATTQNINGLSPGSYTVTVSDGNGHSATSTSTITQPSVLAVSLTATNPGCGTTTGSIATSVSGGTASYSYLWSNGSTSASPTGLTTGNYTVTVTDANGCTVSASASILDITNYAYYKTITIQGSQVPGTGTLTDFPLLVNLTDPNLKTTSYGGSLRNSNGYDIIFTDASGTVKYDHEIEDYTSNSGAYTAWVRIPSLPKGTNTSIRMYYGNSTVSTNPSTSSTWSANYAGVWHLSNSSFSDATSNNNNGTNYSTSNVNSGQIANARSFNGSSRYINMGSGSSLDLTTGMTMSAWIKGSSGVTGHIINMGGGWGDPGYSVWWMNGNTLRVELQNTSTNEKAMVDNNSPSTGSFHHLVVTWDNSSHTIKTYIDGVLASNTAYFNGPIGTPYQNFNIGRNELQGYYFNGTIDEVEVLNTALSADFIAAEYNNQNDPSSFFNISSASTNSGGSLNVTATATDATCYGNNNGAVTIATTGGNGTYTYLWSNGATSQNLSNKAAGTYTVTVTGSGGCSGTASATIAQPTALGATVTGTNPTCAGGNSGSATLSVTGGTTPYAYLWSNGATTQNLSSVTAGTYTVTITDANACTISKSVTLSAASGMTASITAGNVSCYGGSNGTATTSVSGGTSPYTYNWGGGVTTQNRSGLSAGTYTVTVTATGGCTATASVTITQPTALSATVTGTNVSCNGGSNGAATTTVSGGTSAYSYNWGGGITSQNRTGLAAGTFTVTITDANSCTVSKSVTITQPTALSATVTGTNVSCNGGSNGAATLSVSGGTTAYSYNWGGGVTTQNRTGLTAGTYTVTITDANSCTLSKSVTITQPAVLTVSSTTTYTTCGWCSDGTATLTISGGTSGYSYAWSDGSTSQNRTGMAQGSYTVTVTDSKGCTATTSLTISGPLAVSIAGTSACSAGTGAASASASGGTGPYTYRWSNSSTSQSITSLTSGTYSVTTTDALGATASNSVVISNVNISITVTPSSATICKGNSVQLSASGSSSYTWSPSSGLSSTTIANPLASPTATTTYTIAASQVTSNLVTNGDFSLGNVGFTSAYGYVGPGGNLYPEGYYSVDTNANNYHSNFFGHDHTSGSGKFMIINGAVYAGQAVWQQTVNVTPNTNYNFSTWISSLNTGNPANLRFSISGVLQGSAIIAPSVINSWISYSTVWNSGSNTSAVISIVNDNTIAGGNDFGLDDITFTTTCTNANAGQVAVTVNPVPTANAGADQNSCYGQSATLTATGGGTYVWSTGATTASISVNPTTTTSYIVTVTNTYSCTAKDTVIVNKPSAALSATLTGTNATCNGGSNGTATLTVSGGVTPYTYNWGGGVTTQNRTGLAAGTYTVTITDAYACTLTKSVTITQPTAISSTITTTNVSCNGSGDGTATLTVSGGTGAYTYNWGGGITTQNRTGLSAGTYTVTITDASSCTATKSATITQPSALTASIAGTNVGCASSANGAANLTVSGGTTPYSYLWSSGATTEDLSGIAAGTYTVSVTDAHACTTTASVTITASTNFTASIVGSDVSCNGGHNGAADLTVANGGAIVTYLWSNLGVTQDLNNLYAGTYTVTATSVLTGCTATASVTISEPDALVATIAGTNLSCSGGNTGAATTTVVGGTTPYSYNWGGGITTQNRTNLGAGTYTITVTDAHACTTSKSVTITQPAAVTPSISATNVSCNGGSNGAATLSVTGGNSPYTYNWGGGITTQNRTGLAAGTYSVTVTDASSCTGTTSVTITQPATLTASIAGTNVACYGGATGAANLTVTGGTTAYTYLWSNGATTQNLSGKTAGTYSVTVTDAHACTATASVTLTQPAAALSGTITGTNASCNGSATGSVTLTVAGGTTTYTYLWSNSATTQNLSSVVAGTYTVTVTDANACTLTKTTTITEPTAITASISGTNVSCNGSNNGAATLTVSGGTSPYTYNWGGGIATQSRTNLSAGTYTVTVTDSRSCTGTASVTITQPAVLTATVVATDKSKSNINDGAAALTVSGGTSTYSYGWSNGATTQNLTGLSSGVYAVTVTDAHGCTATSNDTVFNPTGPCVCIATGLWKQSTTWSGNCSGGGGIYAGPLDDIVLQGYRVTVDTVHVVKSLELRESTSDTTMLLFTGNGQLTVLDSLNINTISSGKDILTQIDDNAELIVNHDMKVTQSNNNNVKIQLNTNSGNNAKLKVLGNLEMTVNSSGKTVLLQSYAAKDTVHVLGNITLTNNSSSTGKTLKIVMGSSSRLLADGNINFVAVRDGNTSLALNSSSTLELMGSINRVGVAGVKFGKLTMATNANLMLKGTSPQSLPSSAGSGNDSFSYTDLILNNTSTTSPQVVTDGSITVSDSLIFMTGKLSTGSDTLIFTNTNAGAVTGYSNSSYIIGNLTRSITTNTSSYVFPMGLDGNNKFFPATVINHSMIGPTTLTATFGSVPAADLQSTHIVLSDMTVNTINPTGMWTIEPNTQPLLGSYDVQLSTRNFTGLVDNFFVPLKRPKGSGLLSLGLGGGLLPSWGSLTRLVSTGYTGLSGLTSFSEFEIGQSSAGSLPITLLSFSASPDKNIVKLNWVTAQEINNDYFTVERSQDAENFEEVVRVKGAGNSTMTLNYDTVDANPYLGTSYYRLKQTDFDGNFTYSPVIPVTLTSFVETDFNIYPNPNKGSFNVDINSTEGNIKLMILNSVGQLVHVDDIQNPSGKSVLRLDLGSELAAGIYFVKIDAGQSTFIKQMVIQ